MSRWRESTPQEDLAYLRKHPGGYSLRTFLKRLSDRGLSLAEIGTNEAEIKSLTVLAAQSDARWRIHRLREHPFPFDGPQEVRELREELAIAQWSLADLGTSEEELELCVARGYKIRALQLLGELRKQSTMSEVPAQVVDGMLEALKKGGMTLKDIGTSQASVDKMCKSHIRHQISRWLSFIRNGHNPHLSLLELVEHGKKEGGFSWDDLKVSEDEIESFRAKEK